MYKTKIKKWKISEDRILKKNIGKIQVPEIQKKYLPSRSLLGIRRRANRLKLKSNLFVTEEQKRTMSQIKEEWWKNPKNKTKQQKLLDNLKKYSTYSNPMKKPEIVKKVGDKLRNVPKSKEHKKNLSIAKKKQGSWGKHSKKAKIRIGLAHKNKVMSRLTRMKISKRMKELKIGEQNNPMKNPETAKKVSKALKGRVFSDEWRLKISQNRKGKLMGKTNPSKRKDVRMKISKALKGRKNYWLEN